MENQSTNVGNFFKEDLKDMLMAFFTSPVDGHYKNFQKPSDKSMMEAGILMGSVFVIFLLCFMIMFGTKDFGALFKMSLFPVIMMVIISSLSFGLKSVSGKGDFKKEMLTGGLCGIPLAMGIIVAVIMSFISDGGAAAAMNPMAGSILSVIVMVYLLLMMIGVFQQSLKAGGTQDTAAWFASPAAILTSMYLTSKIMENLM